MTQIEEMYQQLKTGKEIYLGKQMYLPTTTPGKITLVCSGIFSGEQTLPEEFTFDDFVKMLREDWTAEELEVYGLKRTSITLNEVYGDNLPDDEELIWNFVGSGDFDTEFQIRNVNPVEWYKTPDPNGQTPEEIFTNYATNQQKKLVKYNRKIVNKLNATRYIVVANDLLVDGWHRMVAFALEGMTEARAVDLSLPIE
jgi:hypothetical protein